MPLLIAIPVAGFVVLTNFATAIGLPSAIVVILAILLTYAGGFAPTRIMRAAGAI